MSDDVTAADGRANPAPIWSTCTGAVVAIHGEVDAATCDAFAAMVRAAVRRAGSARREVHVDLGGLTFIGVCGARVLVEAGAGLGPESHLVVDRPPALLARILDVGWSSHPGLRLGTDDVAGGPPDALDAPAHRVRSTSRIVHSPPLGQ